MRDRILELTRCRAGDLIANPANYRKHPKAQREALRAVLEEIGYAAALIARRDEDGSLTLIDGHLRADLDPEQLVPVLVLDVSEEEAEKLLASMDPITALARPEPEALLALLGRVHTDSDPLADLFEAMRRSAEADLPRLLCDPDEIPSAPKPRAKPGDLFTLGEHRLMCGDATSRPDMRRLMGGAKADLLLTDPPFGVSYIGRTKAALRIKGDSAAGLDDLLERSFARAGEVLREGAPLYVFHPAGELSVRFAQAFLHQGWELRQTLIWKKDRFVLGHGDYHYQHEPILYGYTPSPSRRGRGAGGFYGGNAQSSVLEVPRPAASREHPTAKPVELLRRLVSNSSRRGQIVLDCFGGSGSTLIACEDLSRRAFLMELDPAYCDVIIARFETLTGKKARLRGRIA
ncbi:MAG TPA: DNA modification methylase [Gemmatimonadales bacterium]|nr:DNA modification methylase [Gemmatimonadales bacterium]